MIGVNKLVCNKYVVTPQIFNLTAELAIPIGIPTNKEKTNWNTTMIPEIKLRNCSV